MFSDKLIFAGTGIPFLLSILAGAGSIALIIAQYKRSFIRSGYAGFIPRLLLGLRLAALLVFCLLLLNPIVRLNISPRDTQRIAILVDTSKSMDVADSLGGETRMKTVERILKRDGVLSRLSDSAQTDLIGFDSEIREADAGNLKATFESSDIAKAISTVRDQKDKAPLVAIVLLTDGCETSSPSAAQTQCTIPIFTVGVGSMTEALAQTADIDLSILKADHQAFINSKAEVKVELRQYHLENEKAVVQVRLGEKVMAEETVTLGKDPQDVTLSFTPTEPGLFEYEARVVPNPKEKITENNNRFFSVKVTKEKIRVFYYEGTPRWTYKFMTRELKKDAQVALQAVLRTDVGRAYQSASANAETIVFPSSRQAMKKYDCFVLGDVRAEDLSKAQAQALREYISEDGGGLIVLAGKDSFAGGLAGLGLDGLAPLNVTGAKEMTGNFSVQLTSEGTAHPSISSLSKFLPIDSVYSLGEAKPGSQILAVAQADKASFPFCAAQRYGSGRVFMSLTDAEWKWAMKYADAGGAELLAKFWGQVIRWASNKEADATAQQAATVTTDKDIYRLGDTVKFHAQGAGLDGIQAATIAGESVPVQKNLDRLDGQYAARKPGLYKINVGSASGEFLVERPANEFSRIAMNEPLLRQLAAASGGQYFDAVSARTLPEAIRSSGKIKVETRDYVFAESWWPFVLILISLGLEWSIRKRMQLN